MSDRRLGRLARWQELGVYAGGSFLVASGLAWLLLDTWVRVPGEFGDEPHPAEHWALVLHGIGAYFFLVCLGTLVPVHIVSGWKVRRNRATGATVLAVSALLAATGLGLYYAALEDARFWLSAMHWGLGLAVLPFMIVHIVRGRRGGWNDPSRRHFAKLNASSGRAASTTPAHPE